MIRLTHKFCYSHTTLKITKTLQTLKKSINSVDKFCQFCYQDAASSVLSVSYPLQRTALVLPLRPLQRTAVGLSALCHPSSRPLVGAGSSSSSCRLLSSCIDAMSTMVVASSSITPVATSRRHLDFCRRLLADGHYSGLRQHVADDAELLQPLIQEQQARVITHTVFAPVKATMGSRKTALCYLHQRKLRSHSGPL